VEDFRTVADRLVQRRRPHRQNHEFLDVEAVVGVRAAIDDVHHRHRHRWRLSGRPEREQVAIQRDARTPRRGVRVRE
jgi:hypothetical protein